MKYVLIEDENEIYFAYMDPLKIMSRSKSEDGFAIGAVITDEKGFDTPVGLAICGCSEDATIIHWIYVDEEYRNNRFGHEILDEILSISKELNKSCIKAYVVSGMSYDTICGQPSTFFIENGITEIDECYGEWVLESEDIKSFDLFTKIPDSAGIQSLGTIASYKRRKYLEQSQNMPIQNRNFELSDENNGYEEKLSIIYEDASGFHGLLLVEVIEQDIYIRSLCADNLKNSIFMLAGLFKNICKNSDGSKRLNIILTSAVLIEMMEKAAPDFRHDNYYLKRNIEDLSIEREKHYYNVLFSHIINSERDEQVISDCLLNEKLNTFELGDFSTEKLLGVGRDMTNVSSLSAFTPMQVEAILKRCFASEAFTEMELENALPKLDWFELDLSSVYIVDDKLLCALLVVVIDDKLRPVFLYGFDKDVSSEIALLVLNTINEANKKYPKDTIVEIALKNERTKKLVNMLLK